METIAIQIPRKMTDTELVTIFTETLDGRYFAELYERYYDKVKIYCLKALGNLEQAKDVAQNILIRAFEKLPTLHNAQLWTAWLFTIARNEVLNFHKQLRQHRVDSINDIPYVADQTNDDMPSDEHEQLLSAVETLIKSPEARILKLKYVDGLTIDQLCEDLSLKESTVKMRLLRARQAMRETYYRESERA
jgi:RNA polymerase sigma factor (sigma-70 family)